MSCPPTVRGGSKGGHEARSKRRNRNSRRELEPESTLGSGRILYFFLTWDVFFFFFYSGQLDPAWKTPESGNVL